MLLLTPFTRRLVNRNARHSSILARFLGCARVRESGIDLQEIGPIMNTYTILERNLAKGFMSQEESDKKMETIK